MSSGIITTGAGYMSTTIAANLIIENGKLLMLYRDDKGYWELPAGKVEAGETPRNAAIREAKEEIGCDVIIRSSWNRFDITFEHEGEPFETRGFIADIVNGTPKVQEDRFSELRWMSAEDLLDIDLAPNLQDVLSSIRLLLLRSR